MAKLDDNIEFDDPEIWEVDWEDEEDDLDDEERLDWTEDDDIADLLEERRHGRLW